MIKGSLSRAWKYCSSYENFHDEVLNLENYFKNNGYPLEIFWNTVNSFVNNKFVNSKKITNSDAASVFIRIPYLGKISLSYKSKLQKLFLDKFYGNLNLKCIFRTCKIGDYFSLKCKTPLILGSKVVYKFTCLCDTNISYIGRTKRHFVTRIEEHLDDKDSNKSAIASHIRQCNCCSLEKELHNQFIVIKRCNTVFDLNINEALLIKKNNPIINKQLYQSGSQYVLKVF